MARNQSKGHVGTARSTSQPAQWLAGVLIALSLSLPASVTADVHPYERWADELGIDMNVSYDGIRVMEFRDGKFEASERRAPGKMYSELHMGGVSSGIILREDLKKSYLLMPSMGFYKEDTLEGGMLTSSNGMEFSKIEKVGKEDINGHPSTKFKTRFKDNEGKGAGIIWITDTGVPIKMDMIYSNGDMKGERISMQFTELNLRPQDPAFFELPANLKPMSMGSMADIMKMGAAQGAAATAPATASAPATDDLSAKQQACLKEAAAKAAEQKEKAKQTKGFGRLMGSLARTASRFGLSDIGKVTQGVYDADATADDVAVIAEELGISEDEVERCRQP